MKHSEFMIQFTPRYNTVNTMQFLETHRITMMNAVLHHLKPDGEEHEFLMVVTDKSGTYETVTITEIYENEFIISKQLHSNYPGCYYFTAHTRHRKEDP